MAPNSFGFEEARGRSAELQDPSRNRRGAEMVWEQEGSRIHATINADSIAYAVEVSGKPSPIAKTGRGLALGQSPADTLELIASVE